MKIHLLIRLGIVLAAAALMLVVLPYYWQDNLFHEVAGTGMLVLLVVHNVFNRRWYAGLVHGPLDARSVINRAVVLCLATVMLTLLVTSVMVSNTLFTALELNNSFRVKQIHALAAYWGLIILGAHVGTRWTMLMGMARAVSGIKSASSARTWVLRLAAVAITIQGIRSSFVLNIGSKLFLQPLPDWWDFGESSAGFFLHCSAVAGLYAAISYYFVLWTQRAKRVRVTENAAN